ncbi:TRAP transporter large permease [Geosporobacter ferrireducens]|uniref:C4-dicarboxylate ABC transporter permease n=1 Tax=Geosporobacter ferrireducens TaxID=1424294 RepID=A0A1D8GG38_9FIRM|nr:TRAP transporter large permease [Geosporobacter ferrireducens]AOT69860.1 C4-dicarboxylate ABC transporter permease [Geosporobacter ferrireducens]MTI54445.1 TRAP transporter large permease [Geosporobacter ferrireducens]
MTAVLMGSLIALLLGSVPIFIALNLAVLLALMLFTDMSPMIMIQKSFGGIDKFALMSMPFFIFAANVMDTGGLSERILKWTRSLIGSVRGGLALTTQLACMVFGALSGSSPATVIAMGKLMYPELVKQKYPKGFALGLITSSGSVALLIPPSITLIIYATATGTSVGELFMAGIGAGIVYGIATVFYILYYARKNNLPVDEKSSMKEIIENTKEAVWSLAVPVIILGGIYSGIFTPTEAAGISAVYAIFVGMFIYKEIDLKKLYGVCVQSAVTCAQVLILVAGAQAFGWFLTVARVPQMVTESIIENISSPIAFLLMINFILLIVGMFMEGIAAIIILAPLFYPIAVQMGIDPVHLGIIMVANLCIGNFTPPFGLNLFVANGVTGVSISKIIPTVLTFVLVSILALLAITYIPDISLMLPRYIYR